MKLLNCLCVSAVAFALAPLPAQQAAKVLVKLRGPLTEAAVTSLSQYSSNITYTWPAISALAMNVPPENLTALASDPLVARVSEDQVIALPAVQARAMLPEEGGGSGSSSTSSSPGFLTAWNQDAVDTLDSGLDGDGVTVIVMDSGLPLNWADVLPPDVRLDLDHDASFAPEGQSNARRNHVSTAPNAYIGLHTHGLGVTAIITGFRRLPGLEWMRGAAPRATILPLRVFGQEATAYYSWFIQAFLYAAELKRSGALPGPVVLNLSAGGPFDQTAEDALNYMLAQGVLFVTITHNFGDLGVTWPGTKPESITVGASGFAGQFTSPLWYLGDVPENDPAAHFVAFFSGRELSGIPTASQIDLIGPGDFAISCWGFGNNHTHTGYAEGHSSLPLFRLGIAYLSGSSFAAPHVTAVVAQMLQRNPQLTQAQAEAILRSSALPIPPNPVGVTTPVQVVPPWGANATGAGLLRGGAAVAATPPQ